jgi:hypothetical protein
MHSLARMDRTDAGNSVTGSLEKRGGMKLHEGEYEAWHSVCEELDVASYNLVVF